MILSPEIGIVKKHKVLCDYCLTLYFMKMSLQSVQVFIVQNFFQYLCQSNYIGL